MRIDLYLLETDESPELEHWRMDPPIEVCVDGERLCERVIAFDIENHCVWYIVTDRKGNTRYGPTGDYLIARRTGNVTVIRESDL
jgi:hypothetical protein